MVSTHRLCGRAIVQLAASGPGRAHRVARRTTTAHRRRRKARIDQSARAWCRAPAHPIDLDELTTDTAAFDDAAGNWNRRFAGEQFLFGTEPNAWLPGCAATPPSGDRGSAC
jgi:hypothetical protein